MHELFLKISPTNTIFSKHLLLQKANRIKISPRGDFSPFFSSLAMPLEVPLSFGSSLCFPSKIPVDFCFVLEEQTAFTQHQCPCAAFNCPHMEFLLVLNQVEAFGCSSCDGANSPTVPAGWENSWMGLCRAGCCRSISMAPSLLYTWSFLKTSEWCYR